MRRQPPPPTLHLGDRVRYIIPAGGMGNTDLEGCTGTVVYIDTTAIPVTVQLDEPYPDAVPELRVRDPRATDADWRQYRVINNCWFCRAENLMRIESEPPEQARRRDPAAWGRSRKKRGKAITIVPSQETLKKRREKQHGQL